MINIVYFARVKEELGIAAEEIECPVDGMPVRDLLLRLAAQHGDKGAVLQENNIVVAINHQVADSSAIIRDQDEVAFYPPVTGG